MGKNLFVLALVALSCCTAWAQDTNYRGMELADNPTGGAAIAWDGNFRELADRTWYTKDGAIIVGTGAGTYQEESGDTLRNSLGLGPNNSPQFRFLGVGTAATTYPGTFKMAPGDKGLQIIDSSGRYVHAYVDQTDNLGVIYGHPNGIRLEGGNVEIETTFLFDGGKIDLRPSAFVTVTDVDDDTTRIWMDASTGNIAGAGISGSSFTLPNAGALYIRDAGGTARDVLTLNSGNNVLIGNINTNHTWLYAGTNRYVGVYNNGGITAYCEADHDFALPNDGAAVVLGAGADYRISWEGSEALHALAGAKAYFTGPLQIAPGSSVAPANNGDVVFELTNDTTLSIRAKGSDGTVRSVALTLAP